ncbi:MAG: sugar phosphate isomerase/epimerase family protein [Planctomycetota bacterium]
MRFAICNEVFEGLSFVESCRSAASMGYTGLEVAPFTLQPGEETSDVRKLSEAAVNEARDAARAEGLEIIGLHWLLAKTSGLYLTSPDSAVRERTAEYFLALARLCDQLGGKVLVLGSPQQRNLLPGVSHAQAEEYAAEVLRRVTPELEDRGLTLALEPLGPAEGDFLNTASAAVRLAQSVGSPSCRLHLDIKAMASEPTPISDIIQDFADWTAHFHANDPNLLGPGMGDIDLEPIMTALTETGYDGWVSVEPFRYEPSGEAVARESLSNLLAATGR